MYTGNRLEILAARLKAVLGAPLASPFEKEVILVQSKGMERWLTMELSSEFGVWANAVFPFPNAFLHDLFRQVFPDIPADSPFKPEILTWRIVGLLPDLLEVEAFEPLRSYLGSDGSDPGVNYVKRYQLASRIADLFDQYLFYRPDMIFSWERGEGEYWQAVLWRRLVQDSAEDHRTSMARRASATHRAAQRERFLECMRSGRPDTEKLLQRVSLFGISVLPPFHLEILMQLSRYIEVNIFLMNPCREYWFDIAADRVMARWTKSAERTRTSAELHLERGNSLLASMGKMGSDFFSMVLDLEPEAEELFIEPGQETLLRTIQSDILNLVERRGDLAARAADGSLEVNSCHSPLREVEVLYDRLLALFDENQNLKPEDVLVMTPDITTYTPIIQAVFRSGRGTVIPYNISDRSILEESDITGSFFSILTLPEKRFGVLAVLDILESEAVYKKLGLSNDDLAKIKDWLAATRVKWGIDGEDRASCGLPPHEENTWQSGLARLLLGYAMSGGKMFKGVLPYPYPDLEGEETTALGIFVAFMEKLFAYSHTFKESRRLAEWGDILSNLLEEFFLSESAWAGELGHIRSCLELLAEVEDQSGFNDPVGLDVVRSFIRGRLSGRFLSFGFMSGGITFCAMLPMRSIPFKVICLLGMNDGVFPRQNVNLGFDLMSEQPRAGDRSRRNDDRYLFLETILSARDLLYISYVGQSIRDNSSIPPSVLVSELLDYIGETEAASLTRKHKLQAFNPAYFSRNTGLFSYSKESYRTCLAMQEGPSEEKPFFKAGIELPGDDYRRVPLDDLCLFYKNPVKYLLNRRLGLHIRSPEALFDERETFRLTGLERYQLEQELVDLAFTGQDLAEYYHTARARGILPHGRAGLALYMELADGVKIFIKRFGDLDWGAPLEALEFESDISGFRVIGRVELREKGQIQLRNAKLKENDRFGLWVRHLALNCFAGPGLPRRSVFLAGDCHLVLEPVPEAENILEDLLKKYWSGLQAPLLFFPASSFAFAEKLFAGKSRAEAVRAAGAKWLGNMFVEGEAVDPYYGEVFRQRMPLDGEFQSTAEELITPLLAYEHKSRT